MNEKETALATVDEVEEELPKNLLALAISKQADPDTLSKLMDLQERWQANKAHQAYVAAMTAFKQDAPAVLKKNDVVDFTSSKGRTAYRYANLGSIVQEITATMGKHELSASWETAQNNKDVTVTCHITHVAGHRESVTLTGPIDESGNKNQIQAVGSTVTYLQRYTLLAALGLATGEDDDGRGGRQHNAPADQSKADQAPNDEMTILVLKVDYKKRDDFKDFASERGYRYEWLKEEKKWSLSVPTEDAGDIIAELEGQGWISRDPSEMEQKVKESFPDSKPEASKTQDPTDEQLQAFDVIDNIITRERELGMDAKWFSEVANRAGIKIIKSMDELKNYPLEKLEKLHNLLLAEGEKPSRQSEEYLGDGYGALG